MPDLLPHLRQVCAAWPESYEEAPWGELAAKVRGRMFAMYSERDGRVRLTVKLPHSGTEALTRDDTEATGYGLGRSGWVTASLAPTVDRSMLQAWIEESYRAVAPKTLSRDVPLGGPPPAPLPVAPPTPPADAPLTLVVSDDPLRAQRAVDGLARRGLRAEAGTTDALDALTERPAAALLVDLGRSPTAALAMAEELAMIHFDGRLCLAGIRDARGERMVRRALEGALLYSRRPPGDPTVLDTLSATIGSGDGG